MQVFFLRHGESMGNAWEGAYNDERTNFLTMRGVEQARLAGYTLSSFTEHFDDVYVSDTLRAGQTGTTAMQTFGNWKRHYNRDSRINEWCYGSGGGRDWYTFEDQTDFWERVYTFYLSEIVAHNTKDNADKCILITSHYYVMHALFEIIDRDTNSHIDEPWPKLSKDTHDRIPNAMPFIWDSLGDDAPRMIRPGEKGVSR